MKLSIGPYKSLKHRSRAGVVAYFMLKPKPIKQNGTIYQTVDMKYKLGTGKFKRYRYTEAWTVDQRKRPQIELKGADSFLIDLIDVREHDTGSLVLTTQAWYESGPVDVSYDRGIGDQLWGYLHGNTNIRKVPKGAPRLSTTCFARYRLNKLSLHLIFVLKTKKK